MTVPAYSASARWYRDGHCGYDLRTMKSAGRILDLVEFERPAGDMYRSGLPDLVLCQDMLGGSRLVGNLGGGRFDVASQKGDLTLAAPNFALASTVDTSQQVRALAFPVAQWQEMLDDAANGRFSFDLPHIYGGKFDSPAIRSALRTLWALCDEEGAPSRLLARAAGAIERREPSVTARHRMAAKRVHGSLLEVLLSDRLGATGAAVATKSRTTILTMLVFGSLWMIEAIDEMLKIPRSTRTA